MSETQDKYKDINLTRLEPTLRKITVGVGWDVVKLEDEEIDLDCSLFLLDRTEKTRVDEDFVFYNNMTGANGAIQHTGDNRTGIGDGDDETIFLDLQAIPFDVLRLVFCITIYDPHYAGQNFSSVKNVFFRIVNQENNKQLMRHELDLELQDSKATGVVVAELNRTGPNWILSPKAELVGNGLAEIAARYGIIVG